MIEQNITEQNKIGQKRIEWDKIEKNKIENCNKNEKRNLLYARNKISCTIIKPNA